MRSIRLASFLLALLLSAFFVDGSFAQSGVIKGEILQLSEHERLPEVTIVLEETGDTTSADSLGFFVFRSLEKKVYHLVVTAEGFLERRVGVGFGKSDTARKIITLLAAGPVESEEIVVTATESDRNIRDVPLRVEALPEAEIEEKAYMKPAGVGMLLGESTGLRVQGNVAGSALRMQGLPNRFTQLTLGGIPLFTGLSGMYGLDEISSPSLKRVEIIKGVTSTQSPSSAIAGSVNFVPHSSAGLKAPLLLNVNSHGGVDATGMATFNGIGYAITNSGQPAVDLDGDHFSDIPEHHQSLQMARADIDLSKSSTLEAIGFSNVGSTEFGSTIGAVLPRKLLVDAARHHHYGGATRLTFADKASSSSAALTIAAHRHDLQAQYDTAYFEGRQDAMFADAHYKFSLESEALGAHTLLAGAQFSFDQFDQHSFDQHGDNSYVYRMPGAYVQDEVLIVEDFHVVAGVRGDWMKQYGLLFSPRVSALYRVTPLLSLRAGFATGWMPPTIFTEEVEEKGFHNIDWRLGQAAEKSRSITADINWRALSTDHGLSSTLNLAGFSTSIANALVMETHKHGPNLEEENHLRNASGLLESRGGELQWILGYGDFRLLSGYTYTYATQNDEGRNYEVPLVPKHAANFALMWENEDWKTRVSLEHYLVGSQAVEGLPGVERTPNYSLTGLLIAQRISIFTLYINFENIFDERQTKHSPVFAGGLANGDYRRLPQWMPNEGRQINGGVRFDAWELSSLLSGH